MGARRWVATLVALLAFTAAAALVATSSLSAGILADDTTYYKQFVMSGFGEIWRLFLAYVPGRNLHIPLQDLAYLVTVQHDGDFRWYHVLQSVALTANAALAYLLAKRLGVRWPIALVLALLLVFWPTYQEAAFWPSALPMHIWSGTMLLGLIHACLNYWRHTSGAWRPLAIVILFWGATFTYDQSAAGAACILLAFLSMLAWRARRQSSAYRSILLLALVYLGTLAVYSYLVVVVRSANAHAYGPTLREGLLARILGNVDFGVANLWMRDGLFINEGFWGTPFSYAPLYALRVLVIACLVIALVFAVRAARLRRATTGDCSPLAPDSSGVLGLLVMAALLLVTSIAAYLPAWAWYVSPRHNYVPMLFVPIAFACILEAGIRATTRRVGTALTIATVVTVIALLAIFAYEFRQAGAFWTERDRFRAASYAAVDRVIREAGFSQNSCVEYVDFDIADNTTDFYTEISTWTLDIYARDPQAQTMHCPAGAVLEMNTDLDCVIAPESAPLDPRHAFVVFPRGTEGDRDWLHPRAVVPCTSG